jgi:hypothetical protein
MGEFQYYEFQTIDRTLTAEEIEAVGKLSSHIEVGPSSAVVTYEWGDFKHDPRLVVARYFDAMLYMANWGSRRLVFRFPQELVAWKQLDPYGVEDQVDLDMVGNHLILDIHLTDEDGGEWIECEGVLSSLTPLREDILRGDYRTLYLAWLGALTTGEGIIFDDDAEPPVPPGLQSLTRSLRALAEFLRVDAHLLQAAATVSPELHETPAGDLRRAIATLPRATCEDYLWRLAQGEAHLSLALRRELLSLVPSPTLPALPRRTAGELLERAEQSRALERQREQEEAERRRIAGLHALAREEPQVWQRIEELVSQKSNAKAYDQAVQLLLQLQELATYQQQEITFRERVTQFAARYVSRRSFQERLRKAALV